MAAVDNGAGGACLSRAPHHLLRDHEVMMRAACQNGLSSAELLLCAGCCEGERNGKSAGILLTNLRLGLEHTR